jgi:hypothetical protein
MAKRASTSNRTRLNWLIDLSVFLGAATAILSGIYFLYLPDGGCQGGRNPGYGLTILWDRATWDWLHTWGGVLMIIAAAVHFTYHWGWVTAMARRVFRRLRGQGASASRGSRVNLLVDSLIGASFTLAAVSGVVFLFAPPGSRNSAAPLFIFTRGTWDLIHTWSGVALTIAAALHFAIHWGWVKKVTGRVFRSLLPGGSRPAIKPFELLRD